MSVQNPARCSSTALSTAGHVAALANRLFETSTRVSYAKRLEQVARLASEVPVRTIDYVPVHFAETVAELLTG